MMAARVKGVLWFTLALTLSGGMAAVPAVAARGRDCTQASVGLVPLTDLGTGEYRGEQGGLYPGGSNQLPEDHLSLGLELASKVQPLDTSGSPDPEGLVVLLSIGVSNTVLEFEAFMELASSDPALHPRLVLVNGARDGRDIAEWLDSEAAVWRKVERQLMEAGLDPAQVQVAWVKLPEKDPAEPFPTDAATYSSELALVLRNLKMHYPNVRLAYLSSRIYGGYGSELNPEPFAYQHGFGVKWTIEDQILRPEESSLNADPGRGPEPAPWIAWGPYLWADGLGPDGGVGGIPGRSDGLEWRCEDVLERDGIHPSEEGARKVGQMLLDHFRADPTSQSWFAPQEPAAATTTAVVTTTPSFVSAPPVVGTAKSVPVPHASPEDGFPEPTELVLAGLLGAVAGGLAAAARERHRGGPPAAEVVPEGEPTPDR